MNSKTKKYALPVFASVFALMFSAAIPYVTAEPTVPEKNWYPDGTHDYTKMDIRDMMAKKLNQYCEMSPDEQAELIEKYNKTEDKIAKMNEYCSLDEAGRQAFIENHKDQYRKHHSNEMMMMMAMADQYKKHHNNPHMVVKVEGFTGTILVPDMSKVEDKKATHMKLKEQVTVKLSEAAAAAEDAGLDVMKGSIGVAINENGVKSVAWILVAMNMGDNADSDKMSKTIFVVDAADVTKTAQTTKEYDDHYMENTMMMYMKHKDMAYYSHGMHESNMMPYHGKMQDKIMMFEQKLAVGVPTTGNTVVDSTKAQFLDLLRQLQEAVANGDNVQVDSLREQLKDIRNQMIDMKRFR